MYNFQCDNIFCNEIALAMNTAIPEPTTSDAIFPPTPRGSRGLLGNALFLGAGVY